MRIRTFFYLVPLFGCYLGCLQVQPRYPTGPPPVSSAVTADAPTPGAENVPAPLPRQTFFTTIAEVIKRPGFFAGQKVRLSGKVTNVHPPGSRRRKSTSRFDLADSNGTKVRVDLEKPSALKVGQQVSVEGQVAIPADSAAHRAVVLSGGHIVAKTNGPVTPKPKLSLSQGKQRPAPPPPVRPVSPKSPEPEKGQVF
jgi:hypothetical protein